MRSVWFLIVLLLFAFPLTVSAHKVIVFAWVEGEIIYVEGGFGGDRKARNCPVTIAGETGNLIYQGQTDEQGLFSVKADRKHASDLLVTLDAGEGHKGTWKIGKEELQQQDDPGKHPDTVNKKRQELKNNPSILKILAGIGLIFFLAWIAAKVKGKSKKYD